MRVIKRQQAASLLKEAIVLDLGDVGRQAERIISSAQEKARRLIEDAQVQARAFAEGTEQTAFEKGHAQGLAKGHEEGFAQGLAQGHKKAYDDNAARLAKLQQSWNAAICKWQGDQERIFKEARDGTLELALRLAERLVHRVVKVDSTVIVDQVAACLSHVMDASQVIIRIHPQDVQVLAENLPELASEFKAATNASIVTDAGISPGGCVVSYGSGMIDATLEMQLARAVEMILPEPEVVEEDATAQVRGGEMAAADAHEMMDDALTDEHVSHDENVVEELGEEGEHDGQGGGVTGDGQV